MCIRDSKMIERVSERERIDLVSNLRGEVEERMLRDLATPPMTGEIVSHTLTLSNRVMVSHYPRDGCLQENRSVAHGVPPTVGLAICMGRATP